MEFDTCFSRYVCYTDDQLRDLLTEEIVAANETAPAKPGLSGRLSPGVLELGLSPDLAPEDLDALLLVSFEHAGNAPAYFLKVDETGAGRAGDITQCVRAFFDVLCLGRQARDTSTRYKLYRNLIKYSIKKVSILLRF